MTLHSPTIHTKLDLSDSSSYLPSNLFQPRTTFFNRNKQNAPGVQQLLLRRNRLDSLAIYAKALAQLKLHLTELSLRENNFSKFPVEITVLKNLTCLSLANNQLQSIDHDILSQLSSLQWLNLSNNQLSELPLDIVCCHHLRGLDLENNNISKFPQVIFYLTRLEVLMMQKNSIKTLPANYDFPPTLHTLNLAFNAFTQIPLTLLHKPPAALTHFHLSGNKLGHLSPKFLSVGYEKLISLDLHTCQLSRCSSKFFQQLSTRCPDLRRLNLAINRLTDLPPEIGLLTQLQWLNLNDNGLSSLPSSLSQLVHLVKLGLVQNRIEVLPPFLFLHMLELQKLDIRRNLLKYMPPSVLALAPRQEVDIHVDLAVPHAVFQTLSNPPCPYLKEKACLDHHPYGGSLRTLLFYENPTVEHVDGILCDLGDEPENPESVQVISMATMYSILQSNPSPFSSKAAVRQALMPHRVLVCNHPKFKRADNPMPNMLSEIDEDEVHTLEEEPLVTEEQEEIHVETQRLLTNVTSLRELTLRSYLTQSHPSLLEGIRLDQTPEQCYQFIKRVLPATVVPHMIQIMTLEEARQCDYCTQWYTDSRFQIGYLARLCNNRLQIPIRFNLCSTECTLDAVIRLYQTTMDWHTRQSLAHIDATLLLPQDNPSSFGAGDRRISSNYWSVGLTHSPSLMATRSLTNRTLGTVHATDEEDQDEEDEERSPTETQASSQTTISSVSTLSLARQVSLARSIRNRVAQFASTIFNGSTQDTHENSRETSLLPLVFPNLSLGTTSDVEPRRQDPPPSMISVTSRMVEGRLLTERTQPPLRLSAPTPNPTAFHHLPRDAIRLEKF
ncbi:uncharacterized protein EV154DRAFT_607274 [Mucor mucedo]|uniref:uncharacterized protein n=1 Tax=Mucor mucedo TaxID=29922 RepID=UPI0022202E27|nr:uncharacterized protein EV154DRAFT_607274 [Mucor mucedo]KAI7873253.1 hypothetical protein EV154DRAFT_607274 [Mucor mucedo]